MNINAFYDNVEAHPQLEGISIDDEAVVIKFEGDGHQATRVDIAAIKKLEWEELEAAMLGKNLAPLNYMSRVVGYYSLTKNWNASKLGELRDRQHGNYAIT